ncbi:hypothetical protein [Peribacillus asahii]|uniref:hypothetical protein n=1 Tax=Peribacillus asahii TaxID=228899 RepID=UPI00207AF3EC|nr:hypothetical protein [Peribacillus asahii]USK62345.1 hypothetical protein LIT37_22880 [Peribacillus asahii]
MLTTKDQQIEQLVLFDVEQVTADFHEEHANIHKNDLGMCYCDVSVLLPENLESNEALFNEYGFAVLLYHKCFFPEAAKLLREHIQTKQAIHLRVFLSFSFRPSQVVKYL